MATTGNDTLHTPTSFPEVMFTVGSKAELELDPTHPNLNQVWSCPIPSLPAWRGSVLWWGRRATWIDQIVTHFWGKKLRLPNQITTASSSSAKGVAVLLHPHATHTRDGTGRRWAKTRRKEEGGEREEEAHHHVHLIPEECATKRKTERFSRRLELWHLQETSKSDGVYFVPTLRKSRQLEGSSRGKIEKENRTDKKTRWVQVNPGENLSVRDDISDDISEQISGFWRGKIDRTEWNGRIYRKTIAKARNA